MKENKRDIENKSDKILSLSLGNKKVIWLPELNKYLVVVPPIDKIIAKILKGESEESIEKYCVDTLMFSIDEAIQTIEILKNNLKNISHEKENVPDFINSNISIPNLKCKRYYRINEIVFFIEYETTEIEYLIHPKFAHLEIIENPKASNHFQLFTSNSKIVLVVNGKTIGSWKMEMEHYMTGKVSMEILQQIYHNQENDWMAVFHAAGISNGTESIMFLGDSGNGKSTLSAILMASGFEVLSDDFLPVASKTSQLCSFPAALSIKKHAIDLLIPDFPELKNAKEYVYPLFKKTVRYLSNPDATIGAPKKFPCKALVFVKYEVESNIRFAKLEKDIAFQKLVPDSWISPLEKNATQFLNWFGNLPCYKLTYSDNKKMVETVKQIFNNEL